MLGGEAVAEFVNDLHDGEADPEIPDGIPVEKALERGKLSRETAPIGDELREVTRAIIRRLIATNYEYRSNGSMGTFR